MSWWLLAAGWYLVASVVSLGLYSLDKRRARAGRWRIPESRLHVIDALGGFPGGLVAQRVLRHKTRSGRFLAIFWATAAAHVAAWAWIVLR